MKKIVVFQIVTHFDLGGAEKIAVNLCSSRDERFCFHIIEVARGKGEFHSRFMKDLSDRRIFFHQSLLSNNKIGIILFPIRLLILVLKYRPAIIHSHTEVPDFGVFLFHSIFGWVFQKISYVRTLHNTQLWNHWRFIGKRVERFFIKYHANIAISSSVLEAYKKNYGERPPLIYNGVEEVEQRPFEVLNPERTNILFAGRLEYPKGIDVLMKVITEVENNGNIDFWIIGSGSLYGSIRDSLPQLQHVHYYPKLFGLQNYLASFDYLFMPSYFEGLALMSIEASMAGVPTIINDCPGLSDTLPQDWPLKVKNNDIGQFVRIMTSLDSFDRISLGNIARLISKDHFSIDKMQTEYIRFYYSLLPIESL